MIANIVDILSLPFVQNAIIVAMILGIMLPFVGIIVYLRKIIFLSDTLGQVNMAGVSFSVLLASSLPNFAFNQELMIILWTILGAVLIEFLREKLTQYKEVSLMVIHSLSVALVIIFLSLSTGYNNSLFSILFGNINAIEQNEVVTIIIIMIIVAIILVFTYKKFLIMALEEKYATIYGIDAKFYKYLNIIIISVLISVAIKLIGILLVGTLISMPILIANNFAKSLKTTLLIAIVVTEFSLLFGILLSTIIELPSSAMIVIIVLVLYLLSVIKETIIRRFYGKKNYN